ncbi:glyoxalase superfamily protein [Gluconobacter oxydans]|uniref:glyoxalase superfamily protein n=1 Tax=Gluconobacter oxydans TaxID=442 RepID=UPI0039ED8F40
MTISLEALKRQARQESRSGALSYTQALERLSEQHGFRTFAALKASLSKSVPVELQRANSEKTSTTTSGLKWTLVEPVFVGEVEDAPPFSMDQIEPTGDRLIETTHSIPLPKELIEYLDPVWNSYAADVSKNDVS